jgi:hypothetical protein
MPFSTNKIFIRRFAGRAHPSVIHLSEIEIYDKIDFIVFINITDRQDACPTSVGWASHITHKQDRRLACLINSMCFS